MRHIVNEELENYRKRFQAIMEYTQIQGLNEAQPEEDETVGDLADGMGSAVEGDDTMAMGNDPTAMDNPTVGNDPTAMNNPSVGNDPTAMGDTATPDTTEGGDSGKGVEGLNPQGNGEEMPEPNLGVDPTIGGEDGDDMPEEDTDIEEMEEDDEVIDVDDLTSYQRKTAQGVGKISNELKDLKRLISSFENMVNANNRGIEDLKRELERRAPNAEERINLRKAKSGPFTQNVEDYWENDAPDNYKVTPEDNVNNPKYVITKSDVDGINDWNSISRSFDEMAELNDLRNIFDL